MQNCHIFLNNVLEWFGQIGIDTSNAVSGIFLVKLLNAIADDILMTHVCFIKASAAMVLTA